MRVKLAAVCCLLVTLLFSCAPPPPTKTSLYIYRFNPPAFVEISAELQPVGEIPYAIPLNCSLFDVFPAPAGKFLSIELSCPNGQIVLFLDTVSESVIQPFADTDSHFLSWASDGRSAYLKVDSLGTIRIVRVTPNGRREELETTAWTYDLAAKPDSSDFIFTFSRGLGYGSEMTLSQSNSRDVQQLYVDRFHYLSFARYSPDGSRIAFIKIPDTATPFTVGVLWVMDADTSNPRKLADADAGHGYAANWSPDGEWIAFVKRENPRDTSADQSPDSLISNIYLVNVHSGEERQVTSLTNGRAETPHWSPDGNTLAFQTVLDGRMEVHFADILSGEISPLRLGSACCPAWMRK